ncbi:MAG: SIR2 family protein [Salinivirgaceae bacterium]|nr:SIR2 family protein [Salinivirgaceae bacterium]
MESYKKIYEDSLKDIDDREQGNQVKVRLLKTIVYLALSSRIKKEEETIDINVGKILGEEFSSISLCTTTGIAKLQIPAYSCFELKYNLNSDSIYRAYETAKILQQKWPEAKLYFIYADLGQLTTKIIRIAKKDKLIDILEIRAFLMRIDRVKKLNDEKKKLEQNWKGKRDDVINSAKWSLRENKCSLFLGAGVTISAGGPTWEGLLFNAIKKVQKINKRDFKRIYNSCGKSPIIMGRYLAPDKHTLKRTTDYLQRFILYKDVNLDESELIKAICEFIETDKVESIVTYNFDDLIETAIEQRGKKQIFSVVAKSRNKRNEIPVYHVHGLIPQDKSKMTATPVLSEKEYHDIYRESFHWSNIEQLHALDRNTCFFIGLSMSDPNLRRLLDVSHTSNDNEIHHYAFLKREPLYGNNDVKKNKTYFETIEQQFESVGVWVIWYEQYDDVPRMLREIIAPMRVI